MVAPGPRLEVYRHHVSCRVLGASAAGGSLVRTAVEDVLAEHLSRVMGTIAADGGYWVIRRLDVYAAVGAGWSPRQVAGSVATSFAVGITDVMRAGVDPEAAVWFPDRAAFLSAFLLDLAMGRTRGRWEYAQFADLLHDPSSVVRRLSADEPEAVLRALVLLDQRELVQVVETVDPRGTDEILACLSLASGPVEAAPGSVLDAAEELTRSGHLPRDSPATLLIALTASRRQPSIALTAIASAAVAVSAALALCLESGASRQLLREALRSARWAELARSAGADAFDDLLPLVHWSRAERARLIGILDDEESANETTGAKVHTPFGGMFLFLPLLDDMWDWSAATRDWPDGAETPPARLLRLLVVGAALGRGVGAATARDPLLRRALGIGGDVTTTALVAWLGELDVQHIRRFESAARATLATAADPDLTLGQPFVESVATDLVARAATSLLHALAHRLAGMADATAPYLWRNLLDFDAWVTIDAAAAVVELSNPPLHLLLSLAGLNRGSFRLLYTEETTWTLTTPA